MLKIMKMTVIFFVFTCVMGLMFTSASAQEVSIPAWIKNNAGWWANDQIPDSTFIDGIEFLIEKEIIIISDMREASSEKAESIPAWIKNNAGWWANDQIDDKTFVNGIQHLIKVGIIIVESSEDWSEIIDASNFIVKPSNVKLYDSTSMIEGPFSVPTTLRYMETIEQNSNGDEFIQIWITLNSITGNNIKFTYLNSAETIIDEYDDGTKLILIEALTKQNDEIDTKYLYVEEYENKRIIKYIEPDKDELFRIIVEPKNFVRDDGEINVFRYEFSMRDKFEDRYKEISFTNEINKPVVIIPTFTASAYGPNGFYTFYSGNCNEECLTIPITNSIKDFGSTASSNAVVILDLLGYESITDRQLHVNPNILNEYDSVIVLHNEYVSRTMFNAITSHDNVIFLYPNALYAQVNVDITNNLITLVRGHGYPTSNIANGFDWINENTHPYEYDIECENWEFYPTSGAPNGHMLNCYPEAIIWQDELLLKTLKDLVS